jgi:acyl-CoA synthetase (AMP-forming)/AMP-acid ligase II/acyl carrier protein
MSLAGCTDGVIGEIWVRGPSVAQGYWDRPDDTNETFAAFRADTGDGPYLRTGDLGFQHEGELFIVGRHKDLIIIRGRNHYPQDIEATAAYSHPALRVGCTTAFSVDIDGEERLVIVQEVDTRRAPPELDEVTAAIRLHVTEQHDIQPHAIALIAPGTLPKTTSGKVQRRASRQAFVEDGLAPLHVWRAASVERPRGEAPAVTPVEVSERNVRLLLMTTLSEAAGLAPADVEPDRPFAQYGIDSATATRIAGELECVLGRSLPATLL